MSRSRPITSENACTYFAFHSPKDTEVKAKWTKLLSEARQVIPESLYRQNEFITSKDLELIFRLFDKIYFANTLGELIRQTHGHLTFKWKHSKKVTKTGVAGHCSKKGCYFEIVLFAQVFQKLFSQTDQHSFVSNGVSCYSRLECLLNVFAHELCHLLLMKFCPEVTEKEQAHGKTFKLLAKHLFGHVEYRHALTLRRANQKSNIKSLVQSIFRKSPEHVFTIRDSRGVQLQGKVIRLNPQRALFRPKDTNKILRVPYTLFVLDE